MAQPNFRKAQTKKVGSKEAAENVPDDLAEQYSKPKTGTVPRAPKTVAGGVPKSRGAKAKTPAQIKKEQDAAAAKKKREADALQKKKDAEQAKKDKEKAAAAAKKEAEAKAAAEFKEKWDNIPLSEDGRVILTEYQDLIHSKVKELGVPMMLHKEFLGLRDSMMASGFDKTFPVIYALDEVADGEQKIADGFHRYVIATMLGIKPVVKVFDDKGGKESLVQFILRANTRRSLNSSQKAMIATNSLPLLKQEAEFRQRNANVKDENGEKAVTSQGKSTDIAGNAAGVSGEYVRRAEAVKKADPELAKKVADGSISIGEAEIKAGIKKPKREIAQTEDDGLDDLTIEQYLATLPIVKANPKLADNPAFVADVNAWLATRFIQKDIQKSIKRGNIGSKYQGQYVQALLTLGEAPSPDKWTVNPEDPTTYTMYGEQPADSGLPEPEEWAEDPAPNASKTDDEAVEIEPEDEESAEELDTDEDPEDDEAFEA